MFEGVCVCMRASDRSRQLSLFFVVAVIQVQLIITTSETLLDNRKQFETKSVPPTVVSLVGRPFCLLVVWMQFSLGSLGREPIIRQMLKTTLTMTTTTKLRLI